MKKNTRNIAIAGVVSTAALAFLYIACVFPYLRFTFIGLAGILAVVLMIECGVRTSVIVFLSVTVLSFVIMPVKQVAVFYLIFLGFYPIFKHFAEKLQPLFLEWMVKLLYVNAAVLVTYFFLVAALVPDFHLKWPEYIAIIAVNAVFVAYDISISRIAHFYIKKVRERIGGMDVL